MTITITRTIISDSCWAYGVNDQCNDESTSTPRQKTDISYRQDLKEIVDLPNSRYGWYGEKVPDTPKQKM